MRKYWIFCLLVSSLQAMEQEELSFKNLQLQADQEREAKDKKFAEIMKKTREDGNSLTSEDCDFLSQYEKEHAAAREQKDKEEKDRPVIALERIANALEMHNKIGLMKLYIQLMGPNRPNELEHNLGYDNSQTADYTFNHFVNVVKNLGKTNTESKCSFTNEQMPDDPEKRKNLRDYWDPGFPPIGMMKGGISL